jgi:hypothetical protein
MINEEKRDWNLSGGKKCKPVLVGNLKYGGLGVAARMILKGVLDTYDWSVWTGLVWLRVKRSGGIL